MLIAIDFDDTLTADAELWRGLIESAKALGHHVVCVTARRDTDTNDAFIREWMRSHGFDLFTYFTSLGSKVDFMERRGLKVNVWIDDNPRTCALGY